MKLMKSIPSGIPYIEFDSENRLIFSKATETREGFKHLSFRGKDTVTLSLSGARAKKKKTVSVTDVVTFSTNMKLEEIPREGKKILSPMMVKYLKKIFEDLAPNGIFPRENLDKLANVLDEKFGENKEDYIDDDPTATENEEEWETVGSEPKVIKRVKTKKRNKPAIKIKRKIKKLKTRKVK